MSAIPLQVRLQSWTNAELDNAIRFPDSGAWAAGKHYAEATALYREFIQAVKAEIQRRQQPQGRKA